MQEPFLLKYDYKLAQTLVEKRKSLLHSRKPTAHSFVKKVLKVCLYILQLPWVQWQVCHKLSQTVSSFTGAKPWRMLLPNQQIPSRIKTGWEMIQFINSTWIFHDIRKGSGKVTPAISDRISECIWLLAFILILFLG